MTDNLKYKTCLIYDHGLFVDLATTLSKDFGRVIYVNEWQCAFPTSNALKIGTGIPGVEGRDDIWSVFDQVDVFVFPDSFDGPMQLHLESLGKAVWGSRRGEELENFRKHSKQYMKDVGLTVGPYKAIKGLDNLREHLKKNKDQYVKISRTRGSGETFHALNYKNIEPRLDELQHSLGAQKDYTEFVCEDAVNDAVELGWDGYTIDGQFPSHAVTGIEAKSEGYAGRFAPYDDAPQQLLDINEKLAPALKQYGYRNFFAVETRITKDGKAYVIDPACRFGSPPSEMLQVMYSNLSEIIWEGAHGNLVDPVPAGKWGAELMIHSSWSTDHWLEIQVPEDVRPFVKLRNLTVIDGRYFIVPGGAGVGAVVAVGDTMQDAMDKCKEYAGQVEGYNLDIETDCFDKIKEVVSKLPEYGLKL